MVTTLVFGIAGLVIGIIVAFLVIATLINADLLPSTITTVGNEAGGFINTTTYTLAGASVVGNPRAFSITSAWNTTNGSLIPTAAYSVGATTGIVTNATTVEWGVVNFTYTYTVDGTETQATDRMSANFTEGVDNVSTQVPVILLIAAIVLVLSVLAVLVAIWHRMRGGGL